METISGQSNVDEKNQSQLLIEKLKTSDNGLPQFVQIDRGMFDEFVDDTDHWLNFAIALKALTPELPNGDLKWYRNPVVVIHRVANECLTDETNRKAFVTAFFSMVRHDLIYIPPEASFEAWHYLTEFMRNHHHLFSDQKLAIKIFNDKD